MGFQMPGAFIFPYQDLYWSCGQEFYIAWSEIGLHDANGGETMPSVKFPGSIKARSILFQFIHGLQDILLCMMRNRFYRVNDHFILIKKHYCGNKLIAVFSNFILSYHMLLHAFVLQET